MKLDKRHPGVIYEVWEDDQPIGGVRARTKTQAIAKAKKRRKASVARGAKFAAFEADYDVEGYAPGRPFYNTIKPNGGGVIGRIPSALTRFLKKQNPGKMKGVTHVQVQKLKNGGLRINPIRITAKRTSLTGRVLRKLGVPTRRRN